MPKHQDKKKQTIKMVYSIYVVRNNKFWFRTEASDDFTASVNLVKEMNKEFSGYLNGYAALQGFWENDTNHPVMAFDDNGDEIKG